MRSLPFWDVTQLRFVVTTFWDNLSVLFSRAKHS